ncbi:hypothetical protein [Sphaerisporangium rhizosphaerae]|uniref:Lipoprotein n=1 Tax=Sphaerisporangium rhizosphaerae TaxID=2269375 RepID=A0ABW2PHQ5_9ACTN
MIRRTTALLAVAAALAGCGSGQGTPAATSAPTATPGRLAVYRELTQCIRTHGMPGFPDVVPDPRTGKITLPPGTREPTAAVMRACRSIADRLPPEGRSRPPVTAADVAKLRRFAACMRSNGLRDWPDPDADGDFPLSRRLLGLGKKGMKRQLEACKEHFPANGLSIKNPEGS